MVCFALSDDTARLVDVLRISHNMLFRLVIGTLHGIVNGSLPMQNVKVGSGAGQMKEVPCCNCR